MLTMIPGGEPPRDQKQPDRTGLPDRPDRPEAPARLVYKMRPEAGRKAAKPLPGCGGLSKKEIACICTAAGKAYKHMVLTYQVDPMQENATAWRKRIMMEQWKVASLKDLDHNKLVNAMLAHFNSYTAATTARAYHHAMREDGDANRQRVALHKIREACERSGGKMAWPEYPLSIARVQFKVRALEELSPKAAWALFYTITNRGRSKA